jgi:transposase InsO family protein
VIITRADRSPFSDTDTVRGGEALVRFSSTQDHRLGLDLPQRDMDDFSCYIIAWNLCTTMKVGDVTETLDLALQASEFDPAAIVHPPRPLSDNGRSYISVDLA